MLGKFLLRFPHWTPAKHPGKKLRFNPQLNIKKPEVLPPRHDYIIFKNYTGNEILYNLKHMNELRPSELSSALLEIGVRKGSPEGYDWNKNSMVLEVVEFVKKRTPQYTSRVLTSLAHAFHRLGIQDSALWSSLAHEIIRTRSTIEPNGLGYAFNAFVGKDQKEFYTRMMEIIQNHLRYMNGRDLLHVCRGIINENIEADKVFEKWIYPLVIQKKKMCSAKQLEEYLQLLGRRADFDKEKQKFIEEALQYKIDKKIKLALYDGAGKQSIEKTMVKEKARRLRSYLGKKSHDSSIESNKEISVEQP